MWNAEIYDSFGKERMQPSIDLAARLKDKKFKRILDVGCGSGAQRRFFPRGRMLK